MSDPKTATVRDVSIFTKILDGGFPWRCDCGHIQRWVPYCPDDDNVPHADRQCASCGRPWKSMPIAKATIDEYRAARADDAPVRDEEP